MDLQYQTETKEKSQVLLTITVNKNEVQDEYKKILDETKDKVEIKGFRKGKVPVSILESKFKKSLLGEASSKIVDAAYREVVEKLDDNVKPLAFAQPTLEKIELPELGKDYTFELLYDTYPEFKMGDIKAVKVDKEEVKADDADIQEAIDRDLRQFATIEEKETAIEDGDIVLAGYTVFEKDEEIDKKEKEYIHVGKDFDLYKLGTKIKGMKKGDEKEFSKRFSKDEIESIAKKTLKFKVTIQEVKREVVPELTDEQVKKIDESYESVDDYKKKVSENMAKYAEQISNNKLITSIMEQLIETFEGEIPESMIEHQTQMHYNKLLQRVNGDEKRALMMLKRENLTKETYLEKIKEDAVKEIKSGLIYDKVAKENNITASEDELKEKLGEMVKMYNVPMDVEELFKSYKSSGNLASIENEVTTQKAVDFICDNVKIGKVTTLTFKELEKQEVK